MDRTTSIIRDEGEQGGVPSVLVVIVSFNAWADLQECLASVVASHDMRLRPRIMVVDNASTDGSADMVAQVFPEVELIRAASNLGFAGGNNFGWSIAQQSEASIDYLYLLNQDTVVSDGWLEQALAQLEASPQVGAGQSIICLYSDKARLNTRGNVSHYLGFGFTGGYLEPCLGDAEPRRQIGGASGAAMIVRCRVIAEVGLFQDSFFMYLEDADLSWAIRMAGYTVESIPESVVYHKYAFKAHFPHYFHLEKNRLWLLLAFYRKRTLLILLPAILFMELGQLLFAANRGQLSAKLRSYQFFAAAPNRHLLVQRRKVIQAARRIPDRVFLALMSGAIDSPHLRGRLVRLVVNPFFMGYLWLVRCIVWW